MIEIKQTILIPIEKLKVRDDNPQEMTDKKFNDLVQKIKDEGFRDALYVRALEDGFYQIYAGAHRYKAAVVLELKELPCYIDDIDEDKAGFEMVKDNIVQGNMNPQKFTELFNKLSKKYGKEIAQQLFAMDDDEFKRFYKQVRDSLPEDLRNKLDKSKADIKTAEDLSRILNQLFNDYGDTLVDNFMIIDFGGKKHLWVRCNKELWETLQKVSKECEEKHQDINTRLMEIIQKGVI